MTSCFQEHPETEVYEACRSKTWDEGGGKFMKLADLKPGMKVEVSL